jgi:hypothetical protein
MPARRDRGHEELSPALRHYLTVGCWAGPPESAEAQLDLFLLAGAVLRGNLDGLRALWRDLGVLVKAEHRGKAFAEAMLAGHLSHIDTQSWPKPFGRCRCRDHTD